MRPANKSPEATQEIDAGDVLEVSEFPRWEENSSPSLMRVGMDLEVERFDVTRQIRLEERRRKLARYVLGAVAVSCGILVASLVKRESAAAENGTSSASSHAAVTQEARPQAPARQASAFPADIPPPPAVTAPPPSIAPGQPGGQSGVGANGSSLPTSATRPGSAAMAVSTSTSGDGSSSGTVRFTSSAKTWVWLDGKRVTGTNAAMVSCGSHQVKVGYGAKHAVNVPCGGEVVVSR